MIKVKLKEVLKDKKLSITDVSNATGIARSTLTPIVNNPEDVKAIKFDTLDKLCTYLDVDLHEVIEFKQNESKNEILRFWVSQNKKFGVIEIKRSNPYSEKSGFISFSVENHAEIKRGSKWEDDEFEEVEGSYLCTLEIMNNEEIMSLNTKFGDFKIQNSITPMDQADLKKILEKTDRQELMDLTVQIIFLFMINSSLKLHIDSIDISWSIGSVILDRQKNSFKFENDYKNKTLKNVSDYEEAYNRENRNFNFYNVL